MHQYDAQPIVVFGDQEVGFSVFGRGLLLVDLRILVRAKFIPVPNMVQPHVVKLKLCVFTVADAIGGANNAVDRLGCLRNGPKTRLLIQKVRILSFQNSQPNKNGCTKLPRNGTGS